MGQIRGDEDTEVRRKRGVIERRKRDAFGIRSAFKFKLLHQAGDAMGKHMLVLSKP